MFMSFFDNWFTKKSDGEKLSRPILNKILETMREGAIVVGEDTRVAASNRAAYEAFGRRNGALDGKRLSEILRDLNLHEAFRRALDDGKLSDIELEIPLENHKYNHHVAPVEIDGERSAVGIFYDITQIERLETMRQEFLSNISHELRTPLTSILAFVETLEDGAIDDRENNARFLGVIRKNAERMHRLIDDILELSSIESGGVSLDVKRVDLFDLVEEIFTNLSGKARERAIELTNEVARETMVFADRVRLEQMLTNLIDNAVKFNADNGRVVVRHTQTGSSDDEAEQANDGGNKDVISVSDTGEGISAEHLQRIFERFYRADRARSREIGGTGLGLAIVKHLARLHDGEISVQSKIGKGTTFSLELPKKRMKDEG